MPQTKSRLFTQRRRLEALKGAAATPYGGLRSQQSGATGRCRTPRLTKPTSEVRMSRGPDSRVLQSHRRRPRVAAAGVLFATFLAPYACFEEARAQRIQIQLQGRSTVEQAASSVILPTDRILSRGIARAKQRIAEGEYTQALSFIDEVLGREEDVFVETGTNGEYTGLKSTAARLLAELPKEGRAAYVATYGPTAKRALATAVPAGDVAALRRISRRYGVTPAGRQATLLLAILESDAGRHTSAAMAFQQLLDIEESRAEFDPYLSLRAAASWLAIGDDARAQQIVDDLRSRFGERIRLGGREHRLTDGDDPLESLGKFAASPLRLETLGDDQLTSHRGGPTRNQTVSGGLPHMWVRWKARLLYPALEPVYREVADDLRQTRQFAPLASKPLAVGDHVFIR
ncbi:MAG: hypothetical protein AAF961_09440, partial [Planctomycetota bacterium]